MVSLQKHVSFKVSRPSSTNARLPKYNQATSVANIVGSLEPSVDLVVEWGVVDQRDQESTASGRASYQILCRGPKWVLNSFTRRPLLLPQLEADGQDIAIDIAMTDANINITSRLN